MSLASILKRDIAGREARAKHDTGAAKAKDESLIHRWEGELLHPVEHTVPHPRAGIDYAYGEPRLVELRAAGVSFIGRYLGGPESKIITATEAERISKGGISIVTVWETDAERVLSDHAGGKADARMARDQLEAAGAPRNAVAYFAIDFEAGGDEYLRILGYMQGAQEVLGFERVGVYGGYSIVHELLTNNHVRYGWQTLAWSAGRWSPHAQLRQIEIETEMAGIRCDLDRSAAVDFGQWRR